MAGWLIATLAMTVAGRELGRDVSVFVLMLLRSLDGGGAPHCPSSWRPAGITGPHPAVRLHVIRNVVHYGAQYAWFSALVLIPLAAGDLDRVHHAAVGRDPRLRLSRRAAHASPRSPPSSLGFAGIIAIVRPGVEAIDAGHLLALSAALGFSVSVTLTKFLTRTDSPLDRDLLHVRDPDGDRRRAGLAGLGNGLSRITGSGSRCLALAGTFSHYCLSKRDPLADTTMVMPMDFLRVPLTALLGYWLYGEGIDALVGRRRGAHPRRQHAQPLQGAPGMTGGESSAHAPASSWWPLAALCWSTRRPVRARRSRPI